MVAHASLPNSELHETKGVISATDGHVHIADSSIGTWGTLVNGSLASGMLVQMQRSALYTTYTHISTAMPVDNTIPQNTEGAQIATVSIIPKNFNNLLEIEIQANGQWLNAVGATWAIFQDSTANAIAAGGFGRSDAGSDMAVTVRGSHFMTAGTTSSTTFKLRAGPESAGDLYINGGSSNRLWGGVAACWIKVTEYKA